MSLLLARQGPATITGTLSQTLGALTLAATVAVEVSGQAAATLGALACSAAADVEVHGSASVTLGAATVVGEVDVEIHGALAVTLGSVTAVGSGTVEGGPAAAGGWPPYEPQPRYTWHPHQEEMLRPHTPQPPRVVTRPRPEVDLLAEEFELLMIL